MTDSRVSQIALALLLLIFSFLGGVVLGLNSFWQYLVVAPLALIVMAASFDLRDKVLGIFKPAAHQEWQVIRSLYISLIVIPLPVAAALWSITLVIGPFGAITGFYEAWRHAASFLIIYCLMYIHSDGGRNRMMSLKDWIRSLRAARERDARRAG